MHFLRQNTENLAFEIVPFQNTHLGCSYLLAILLCGETGIFKKEIKVVFRQVILNLWPLKKDEKLLKSSIKVKCRMLRGH